MTPAAAKGRKPGTRRSAALGLKVYLDDVREAPEGWTRRSRARETINLIAMTGRVTHLSLDHDLGDDPQVGCGYDVLLWLEEAVGARGFAPPEHIMVHRANVGARPRMEAAVESISRLARDCDGLARSYAPPATYPSDTFVESVFELVLCASDRPGELVTAEALVHALGGESTGVIAQALVMLSRVWGCVEWVREGEREGVRLTGEFLEVLRQLDRERDNSGQLDR